MYKEQEIDNFLDTNPDREDIKLFCQHYALSFNRQKNIERASAGAKALWEGITPEQKAERIKKMNKARVDKYKKASK